MVDLQLYNLLGPKYPVVCKPKLLGVKEHLFSRCFLVQAEWLGIMWALGPGCAPGHVELVKLERDRFIVVDIILRVRFEGGQSMFLGMNKDL